MLSVNYSPTPYTDVNQILNILYAKAETILGSRLVGMYLYGSLASGDFNPETSDLDFVFVTTGELPEEVVAGLEAMHADLWASELRWAAKLEGTYIPQAALRRYEANGPLCPWINEGRFSLERHNSDWVIQRQVLRQGGVVVAGPPLANLIDPVDPEELRQGVLGILKAWWVSKLATPDNFRRSDYQVYAVLTMCRALYTIEKGVIASKPVSARWAQAVLGERWAGLIGWALDWSHATQTERFDETLAFIRYTLSRLDVLPN
jgi:hypothetical protein